MDGSCCSSLCNWCRRQSPTPLEKKVPAQVGYLIRCKLRHACNTVERETTNRPGPKHKQNIQITGRSTTVQGRQRGEAKPGSQPAGEDLHSYLNGLIRGFSDSKRRTCHGSNNVQINIGTRPGGRLRPWGRSPGMEGPASIVCGGMQGQHTHGIELAKLGATACDKTGGAVTSDAAAPRVIAAFKVYRPTCIANGLQIPKHDRGCALLVYIFMKHSFY